MNQQTQQSGYATPASAPLCTLTKLGDEGMRQVTETDLTPLSPFSVNPGWYERYWYGDRPPSRWALLASICASALREAQRIGETTCRAIARAMSVRVRLSGTTSKVWTSLAE
jgi:hypothetical protein